MNNQLRKIALVGLSLTLSACGNFIGLKQNIETIDRDYISIKGVVSSKDCPDCAIMIAVLSNADSAALSRYSIAKIGEVFDFKVPRQDNRAFLFADRNQNFTYDKGESYAWLALDAIEQDASSRPLQIDLKNVQQQAPTYALGNLLSTQQQSIPLQKAKVTKLSNPIFNQESASQGMWRPAEFILAGKAGIYFLGEYSAAKEPVLFVHGIAGNPSEFSSFINQLDHSKYQAWVFFYPSGLALKNVAQGLESLMTEIFIRYKPKRAHLVAHSMGGLVTREYLGLCGAAASCSPWASYTTIASPFGGHASAQGGVDYSPVVMPVWNDMAPSSQFLQQLPISPLPKDLKHHLVIAYLAGESSDSVIEIASQLHQPIQEKAGAVRGFEGSHTGVLKDQALIDYVMAIWQEN
ncbi:alpha/beta hydrolase [Simiduia curdlanivorans]|uniref:Lipase family alpha/beta hydrolase n=1 Tax=Simiduia curdlanivorans TaxID=1492769 RepID=A0ABV8V4E4_9GAMM|nr:alpha/beta hydrolase [Simiduia curdlanivorans]MDN3637450.1 alpha/beta hydrolase [Simiduia curdlanivorans]